MLMWLSSKRSTLGLQKRESEFRRNVSEVLAGAGVPSLRQALPRLTAEFARARRHERPLSVAIFQVGGAPDRGAARHRQDDATASAGHDPFSEAFLGSVLRDATRDTDIVTYAAALGSCIVAMPETDAEAAGEAVSRLRELCARRFAVPLRVRIASFPADGLTFEELVRRVEVAEVTSPRIAALGRLSDAVG